LLLGHVLNLDAVRLAVDEHMPVAEADLLGLEKLAKRRLAGEPVARIFGEKEFYGLNFALNEASLVPRPETELLVERGLEILGAKKPCHFADLGTGSGCIMISLLAHLPHARATGVDISDKALAVAQKNAFLHGVNDRARWVAGSWYQPLGGEKFDLIVSNPPYIASAEIEVLAKEVRIFDPELALDGGNDGLVAYRQIIVGAAAHLRETGVLLLEIGHDQGEAVSALCRVGGFGRVEIGCDLARKNRVITARR
jgi:release factor glutamine methyltransferase